MKSYLYFIPLLFLAFSTTLFAQKTVSISVAAPEDDLEEYIPGPNQTQTPGTMDAGSSDLELGSESANNVDPQLVGIRFANLNIPRGSMILSARIVFTVDATNKNTDPSDLIIHVEDNADPSSFDTNIPFNISSRPVLHDSIFWHIPASSWSVVGEAGPDQTTPELRNLVQQMVNRQNWTPSSSLVFTVYGSGTREAESYDGSPDDAAKLVIKYIETTHKAIRISSPEDDLEEYIDGPTQTKTVGSMDAGSSDLELATESGSGADPQLIGMRFQNIDIPKGSQILSARIQFTVDEVKSQAPGHYIIKAQSGVSTEPFDPTIPFNISSRPTFADSVIWDVGPDNWNNVGEAGPDQLTSDLSSLLTKVISQDGWVENGSVVFTVYGTGCKVAESYDGSPDQAPLLLIDYFKSATLKNRVSSPEDDLEEYIAGPTQTKPVGSMDAGSSDLELGSESGSGADPQLVGIRFQNVTLDPDAVIQSAHLQFTVDELKNAGPAQLVIKAQADLIPAAFDTGIPFNISSRPTVSDSVMWSIGDNTWTNAGDAGDDQRSPDITTLLKAVMAQPGWQAGNPVVFLIYGNGTKVAESYDGSPDQAPELIVQYLSSESGLDATPYPILPASTWSYYDDGTEPATDWTGEMYNDREWKVGKGILGYNDASVSQEVSSATNTVYFRKRFTVEKVDELSPSIALQLLADDAAEIFVNENLVVSFNVPVTEPVESYREKAYFLYEVPRDMLHDGVNVITAKVMTTDADLLFDLSLTDFHAKNNDPDFACSMPGDHLIGCFESIIPTAQDDYIRIPPSHVMQYIARKDEPYTDGTGVFGDDFDFTGYVPIGGSSRHGYLAINSEAEPGGVSVTEIKFNPQTGLWEKLSSTGVDFSGVVGTAENCSGTVTPWGTSITCEEDAGSETDADGDGYFDYGWCIEIDPVNAKIMEYGTGKPQKLWALGRMDHENVAIAPDQKTVYYAEDRPDGSVYKFIAAQPGNLSSGDVYALKLDQPLLDYEPTGSTGKWVKVPNATPEERNHLKSTALNILGATPFAGNEDVDISPVDGRVYFSVKGAGRVYRFKDEGTTVTGFETFVGGTDYVIHTEYGKVLEPWGQGNDNLTFDEQGNLFVLQDGTRNFIWLVGREHTQADPQVNVFMGTVSGSEPTGMTFTPDHRYMFMSIQSPNGTQPQADVTGSVAVHDKDVALVIAASPFLGQMQVATEESEKDIVKSGIDIYPNPFDDQLTVEFELLRNDVISIALHTLTGQTLEEMFHGKLNRGKYSLPLQLKAIPSGLYILTVRTNDTCMARKVCRLN